MRRKGVKAGFVRGGSTRYLVDLLEEGLTGCILTDAPENWNLPTLSNPYWDPLWAAAQERGLGFVYGLTDERSRLVLRRARYREIGTVGRWVKPLASEFLDGCTALEVRDMLASGPTVSGLASIEWGARAREAGFVAEIEAGIARLAARRR